MYFESCKVESENTYPVEFFVVDTHSPTIIGLKTCEKLDLIKSISSQ